MKEQMTGICKYCGQVNIVPMTEYVSEEEKDAAATEICNCDKACGDRIIKNANGKIEEMFLTRCEKIGLQKITERQAELLKHIVKELVEDNALSVSITFGFGIKADVKINSKEEIEIKRTDTRASKEAIKDK